MGQSIDLHIYELAGLKDALKKRGVEDGELLDRILSRCGTVIGDKYVLLNNELWDGHSPYYNLSLLIDSAFKVKDSFDDILGYGKPYHSEGINHADAYDVAYEYGITIKEETE